MQLIMQGMRRSGTTIFFDALSQDPVATSWYEPLGPAERPAVGGGSAVQRVDHFAPVREARAEFAALAGIPPHFDLSYGAPAAPPLEFQPSFSPHVAQYLASLLDPQHPFSVVKFVRAYCKPHALAEIAPEARFLHLVRDPRAVVASYLLGRKARNAGAFPDNDVYFNRTSDYTAWSSGPFSDIILQMPEYAIGRVPTDLERILIIWRFTFEQTRRRGITAFGDRYLLARHEDFCRRPDDALQSIYALVDKVAPPEVLTWAHAHVVAAAPPFANDDPRWDNVFEKLGMRPALIDAGYR